MASSNGSLFASVIEEHLELRRRNRHLDDELPLDEFVRADPFTNNPLFKSEDDARREEEETGEHPAIPAEDTAAMSPVETPAEPQSWMEAPTVPDFNWD